MVATLRDVAEAAGVHPGTVSRALNNPVEVSAKTVARVRKAAAKLGYVPNPNARGLKTSRSNLLGVVVPDLTNPLFPPIIRGIDDTVGRARVQRRHRQHRHRPRSGGTAGQSAAGATG